MIIKKINLIKIISGYNKIISKIISKIYFLEEMAAMMVKEVWVYVKINKINKDNHLICFHLEVIDQMMDKVVNYHYLINKINKDNRLICLVIHQIIKVVVVKMLNNN